ncbi:MAG: multicopper oxidase family protein [Dinoroseobacter sp.]|nr:multicopper oxidase family protein [Dinoroseobacter sp.]
MIYPTRRGFLAGGAAALATLSAGRTAFGAPATNVLRAAPASLQIAPSDYPETAVWAYNESAPGPELRITQGEMFRARLENALPTQGTTIHWHGVRLPNEMDGVPNVTQPPVMPGESFEYSFTPPDAGTFWYHPHQHSTEQISRGLSGVLIVEEPEPPQVDADLTLVLDDWRMTEDAQIHESFGNRHDLSHAGRLGNYVTVNGQFQWSRGVRAGDRLRLRLVNTATARIFNMRAEGLRLWVAALDGMPLAQLTEVTELTLAPAQRIDVVADVTAEPDSEALLASVERDGNFLLASFPTDSQPAQAARDRPAPFPPNEHPEPDPSEARKVALVMEGGAMRGLPDGATLNGQKMDMRALVDENQFWAFNGIAGMSEAPLIEARVGETIRIAIENRTAFPHAQHLHGYHFRLLAPDGTPGAWRDTVLVNPDETREIAFVAQTPGSWMFHCHMLSHQMAGMMTWIRVTA